MKTTIPLLFTLLLAISGFSCNNSPDENQQANLQGGYILALELAGDELLADLVGNRMDETALAAIVKSRDLHQVGVSDWIDSFMGSFPEETPIAAYFSRRQNDLSLDADKAAVLRWLQKEFEKALKNAFRVTRLRVDEYGVAQPNVGLDLDAGQIILEIPGLEDPVRFKKMVLQSGDLGFWRTGSRKETYSILLKVNEWSQTIFPVDSSKIPQAADMFGLTDEQEIEKFRVENPLMGKFNLEVGMNPDRSYIAYAALEDTAGINRILGPARKMGLFGDFDFLWMSKTQPMMEDNVPLLPLIAIRNTSDGQPLLGGEYIVNARADFTVDSGEPMISISMNSEGSQIWSRLTRNEIGREIAITLDGNVLTAPRVQQEITGGRSQITGSFTPVEAGDLAAILRAGALPTPLRIVNEEVIAPSTHD